MVLATTRKVARIFDHVIICILMTNKKCYVSNSTSLMDTKRDRAVVYQLQSNTQRISSLLVKVSSIY